MQSSWHVLAMACNCVILVCVWLCLAPIDIPNAEATAAATTLPSKAERAQLPPDGGPHYNRLVFEQSPYLLQHAIHPVDWYPWGQAAFDKAQREDKPVFLSIGYSTCHWCHVMARESFADVEVARLMSKYVVAVKVDREERPDIDYLYMQVCHQMAPHCGWPLNVLLTPQKKPFFVSVYLPRQGHDGRPGMLELLPRIHDMWRTRSSDLRQLADRLVVALQTQPPETGNLTLGVDTLKRAYAQVSLRYDVAHGGFGAAPKFPMPLTLGFLLRYWHRTGQAEALRMSEHTLQAMRRSGLYDHIGFGFHRYATDAAWQLPHFEKMLYDQAMHLMVYTEAYQATGKTLYAQTAREIATYVLRDMTSPEGGFYSAQGAESAGQEGLFYLWTMAELKMVLPADDVTLFMDIFQIAPAGNLPGETWRYRNLPRMTDDLATIATRHRLSESALRQRLERMRRQLLARRKTRPNPFKDDKILTDWNGLMIAALAKAGQALQTPAYIDAARRAADFLLHTLRDARGRLLKSYRDKTAVLPGHVRDYAYVIWGLLDLYEATFTVRYLQAAMALQEIMLQDFWDDRQGGLFFTAKDREPLLTRLKDTDDTALPSGNSAAWLNLQRVARMTAHTALADKASQLSQTFTSELTQDPAAHTLMMSALDFSLGPTFEVVISGHPGRPDTIAMLHALRRSFLPKKVVVFRPADTTAPAITALAPFSLNQKPLSGRATAYVCQRYLCNEPTTDPQTMLRLFRQQ